MLSVLYAAIATEMAAINAYVVPLFPDANGVIGGDAKLERSDAPPRMIFQPSDFAVDVVWGPGGNPRPIATILDSSECIIHGQSTDHVQGMLDQFIIAVRAVGKKANGGQAPRAGWCQISKGKWTRNTNLATKGWELRFTFTAARAVIERKWAAIDPSHPPQPPLPPTYVGPQAQTYPTIPAAEMTATTGDVGVLNGHAEDNVPINVPPPSDD